MTEAIMITLQQIHNKIHKTKERKNKKGNIDELSILEFETVNLKV
jgi:hypothetical protein